MGTKKVKTMKRYIANYTDKATGSSWDLFIMANNWKEAQKEGREATRGLMAGCKFENVRIDK